MSVFPCVARASAPPAAQAGGKWRTTWQPHASPLCAGRRQLARRIGRSPLCQRRLPSLGPRPPPPAVCLASGRAGLELCSRALLRLVDVLPKPRGPARHGCRQPTPLLRTRPKSPARRPLRLRRVGEQPHGSGAGALPEEIGFAATWEASRGGVLTTSVLCRRPSTGEQGEGPCARLFGVVGRAVGRRASACAGVR